MRAHHPTLPRMSAITDVAGILVGHYTDPRRPTGCTAIVTPDGALAAVDVRGAAPGTRETDLLDPANLVDRVHAIMLSGGSAFGLAAAHGAMRWLEENGHGFPAAGLTVPIVPSAVLFDLQIGDPRIRPDDAAGHAACAAAPSAPPAEGSVGAGATVGKLFGIERAMKSGIGTASARIGAVTVGAIVAVNAVGDVLDETGDVLAGARDSAMGTTRIGTAPSLMRGVMPPDLMAGMATTIGCVATDAVLTKAQAKRLAQVAHDGLARRLNPAHTMWDGDTVFALVTGRSGLPGNMMLLAVMAAGVMAEAVLRAVRHATRVAGEGVPPLPTVADLR
jgi:L-aminopeptidase/D-esterase-like protein